MQNTQVGNLTLNKELTSMAQQWAEQLASTNSLKHSNLKYWGQPVGENVAAKSGSQHVDYAGRLSRRLLYCVFCYWHGDGHDIAGLFNLEQRLGRWLID